MTTLKPLNYKNLRRSLNAAELYFKTTREIKILSEHIGQDRAVNALKFGLEIKSAGYNLYAMGPTGIGKRSLIKNILTSVAAQAAAPFDWCYVNNFVASNKPIVLKLKAGKGFILQQDMIKFVDEMGNNILSLFESENYQTRLDKIKSFYDKKRKKQMDKSPYYCKLQHIKEKKLQKSMLGFALKPSIKKLRKKYSKYKSVLKYLSAVHDDILDHYDDFIIYDEKANVLVYSADNPALNKYKVNLLVDNAKKKSAPVIFEDNPTYSNLICRIEHTNVQGVPTTNFTLIKAGSVHKANGGYLVIEARKIKNNMDAWEALKGMLYAKKISIKSSEQESRSLKPISLEPMSIPVDVKVILIGSRGTYYSFCENDPDFIELFKVPADFDEQIPRNKKNIELYTRLIAAIINEHDLLPFHASAAATIIDYSSRIAEDVEKLSTQLSSIEDLITEADYWARIKNKKIVRSLEVKSAIDAKIHRMDRARQMYYEEIKRNFIIIKTMGKTIGQVNCLSVRRVGDFSYGHPTRVTARVRQGKGKIIDIQREIKMAGPLHSKASLTISNFFASRFTGNKPFSLTASISFEQIYVWTDGDSASVGELCALLSALAEIPLYQHLAITGSIDQYGEVQAVGGINEKIEGFYDVCKLRGLTGNQGVLIPAVNVNNLMLREDIVEAAKAGKFSIYPIKTVDEAISLMTGFSTGKRNLQGNFPEDTIYYKIEMRLLEFMKCRK